MKKVAIITNIPSPYRVDFFYYLQTHIKEYEFHIIYTNGGEDDRQWAIPREKMVNSQILKSRVLKLDKGMDNRYVHLPLSIGSVLSKLKPNAVIAAEYNPSALQALLWCRLNRVKFIHWTDGTLRSESYIGNLQKLSRKIIIQNADACIASSTKAKEKLLSYGAHPEKIYVSYLTVNTDAYIVEPDRSNEIFQILFVGRLVKGKGLDLLMRALKKVQGNYRLIVVGDGPERENYEKQAWNLGLGEKVCFVGFHQREEIKRFYSQSNLFVLPTLDDCFGLVILEAMCASLPVITTIYADGAPDLIEDGVSGIVLDPHDRDTFAKTIQRFLDDSEYAESMALRSFKHISKFHFSEVSKFYVEAINSVLL